MNAWFVHRVGFVCLFIFIIIGGSSAKRKPKTRVSAAINQDPSDSCGRMSCGSNQHVDSAKCLCVCNDGFRYDSRYGRCEDINECREYPNRCKGTCSNNQGSFDCRCRSGYVRHLNGWDCYKAPKVLPCKGLACYHGAKLDMNSCTCSCGQGMTYDFIDEECVDIDECAEGTDNCEQGCINTNRGYICYCEEGYTVRPDNRSCSPLSAKPELLPCYGMQCPPGTSLDTYHCECLCQEGYYYRENHERCDDIDECREYQEWCDGSCRNAPVGSYTCSCPDGTELDKDGWTCNEIAPIPEGADVDECTESDFMCESRMSCVPDELVCDGYNDCADGSDEKDCKRACNTQDYWCANGEKCIHKDSACDSVNDCGDWSDELECGCQDERDECGAWEFRGECESNPGWMHWHCRRSCHQCEPGDGTDNRTLSEKTETGAYYVRHSSEYSTYLQYTRRNKGTRPGSALNTWQCDLVTPVPSHIRVNIKLSPYYTKYTNAYAIPIVSSDRVSDEALRRACYVVRVMLADRRDLRQRMYDKYARVAIVAENELILHLPEHSHLPETYNDRVRSLGGTLYIPLTSAAEENLLCRENDRWHAEDTFVHSFAHAMLKIGLSSDRQFTRKLGSAYFKARRDGRWANTRSDDSVDEYFADGAQSYFGVQAPTQRGVHSGVDSREKLERYDPELYELMAKVFPCKNKLVDRCDQRSLSDMDQVFVNCQGSGTEESTTPPPALTTTEAPEADSECVDKNGDCAAWAANGECTANARYMRKNCALSCDACTGGNPDTDPEEDPDVPEPDIQQPNPEEPNPPEPPATDGDCEDSEAHCQDWARRGECQINPDWMRLNCRRACNACDDDPNCYDSSTSCPQWAEDGECEKNDNYMASHCMLSCGVC